MNLQHQLDSFLALDYKMRLDNWQVLLSVANEFLLQKKSDIELAKKIAESIYDHRSLMGSSKAYESATDIDILLCKASTPVARIAYGKTKPLIDFLKDELYYANFYPEEFKKELIDIEIKECF